MTISILADTVRVAGFRGIKNLEMSMSRVTVLLGMNNSGKTSLLKVLQLALGDYSRYIKEEDFYICADGKRVDEIKVDIRFVPVDADGQRVALFVQEWQAEFGDGIKAEHKHKHKDQFYAVRTSVEPDKMKGGFKSTRYILQEWPESSVWEKEKVRV